MLVDEGLLPITVPWREKGLSIRWRKGIEFKRKKFLFIGEMALTHVVEDTICGVAIVVVNILNYV